MLWCGVPVREIEVSLFGAEIRSVPTEISFLRMAALHAAGPCMNLLTAALMLLLAPHRPTAVFFACCSVTLAVLNLLPIRTLDGGCIAAALLFHMIPQKADRILTVLSAAALFLLWLAAAYLLLLCGGNVSLLLFCMVLFKELYL